MPPKTTTATATNAAKADSPPDAEREIISDSMGDLPCTSEEAAAMEEADADAIRPSSKKRARGANNNISTATSSKQRAARPPIDHLAAVKAMEQAVRATMARVLEPGAISSFLTTEEIDVGQHSDRRRSAHRVATKLSAIFKSAAETALEIENLKLGKGGDNPMFALIDSSLSSAAAAAERA